jgi:hypothetical protein
MNWGDPRIPWLSLPFYFPAPEVVAQYETNHDPETLLDPITMSLLRGLAGSYQRVWLILPADSPGADLDGESSWLRSRFHEVDKWIFSTNGVQTRLILFDLAR